MSQLNALNTAIGNLTSNVSAALTNYQLETTAILTIYKSNNQAIDILRERVREATDKFNWCNNYYSSDFFNCL